MKHVFVINSYSLKDETLHGIKRIEKVVNKLNLNYEIRVISKKHSVESIMDDYIHKENIIYAVGGDGTVNRVVNNIANTDNVLGVIPLGTGNDFYRSIIEELDEGYNYIDLMRITNGYPHEFRTVYGVNAMCFGIDADISNNSKIVHSRIIPKSQRYNLSVIYNLLKFKPKNMQIEVDNGYIIGNYSTVVVANGRYYGRGYKVAPRASIQDGLLDIYVANEMNRRELMKLLTSMKDGLHEYSRHLKKYTKDSIRIRTNNITNANIDGEKNTSDTFDIDVINEGLTLYYDKEITRRILKK